MSNLADELAKLTREVQEKVQQTRSLLADERWKSRSPAALKRIENQLRLSAGEGHNHEHVFLTPEEECIAEQLLNYYAGQGLEVRRVDRAFNGRTILAFRWNTA